MSTWLKDIYIFVPTQRHWDKLKYVFMISSWNNKHNFVLLKRIRISIVLLNPHLKKAMYLSKVVQQYHEDQ